MTTQSTHLPPDTWNARNLLTVLEVAEWARVHPKTVYRWIQTEDGFLAGMKQDVQADETQEKVSLEYIDFRYRHTIMINLSSDIVNALYWQGRRGKIAGR